MATPGGSNFDDVLREAEGLTDDIAQARQSVQRATVEAQRLGRDLRIPKRAVPTVVTPAEEAASNLRAAQDVAKGLEKEYREALRIQKSLSQAQRGLLRDIAANQGDQLATATTRGFDISPRARRTAEALQRRGLVELQGNLATATSAGLGAHDPSLVQGDIINQGKFVRALAEEQAQLGANANRAAQELRGEAEVLGQLRRLGGALRVPSALASGEVEALRSAIEARRQAGAFTVVDQGNQQRVSEELRKQAKLERDLGNARARNVSLVTQALIQQRGIEGALRSTDAALAGFTPVRRGVVSPEDLAKRVAAAQPPSPPAPPPPPAPPTPPFRDPGAPFPRRPRQIEGTVFPAPQDIERIFRAASAQQILERNLGSSEEAIRSFESAYGRASIAAATSTDRIRRNRIEVQRSMSEYGAFSNEMRKHGAATTEFLTALAKGRTTIGEVGFQALATAGKFAAWTAASVGVFGALTTVAAAGRGAIDSMSGVNELSRFINDLDTGAAQEQFRALSREFNLPIATVTEAFAGMGRTFGEQNKAFEATRQVLLAMRVGELEVADSTRFLSAIVAGFGLQANELPQVIDQINQAQNKFNFQIRDGVSGISRAAGTWKAAAADGEEATATFSALLAVMTTAQRSTGATGEVVGTALRRSAEFIGRERNRVALRGFGIDPEQGISEIFRQAFAQVQTGQVEGQDVTRLATALSSPQLASIIAPTLQNFKLFNQVLRDTNAEASRGSARRELAIQLDAIREQASRVVNTLEQLGSALGQAGAFDAFGALLVTLNTTLETATDIVDAFNGLPDPIQKALIYGGQLYGLFRLLRRLNVGESLAVAASQSEIQRSIRRPFGTFTQRSERFGASIANSPDRQRFREVTAEQDASLRVLRQERELLARETATLARETARASERARNLQVAGPGSLRGLSGLDAANVQRLHNQEVQAAVNLSDELAVKQARYREELVRSNVEIEHMEQRLAAANSVGRRRPGEGLRVFTEDQQFPVATSVRTFERPAGELSTPLDRPPSNVVLPPSVQRAMQAQATAVVNEVGEATERAAVAGATAAAADRATAGVGRTQRGIATAGRGLARFGSGVRGLGSALLGFIGPLEIAFLGLIFLPDIISKFQRSAEARRQQLQRLRTPALDPDTFRRRLQEADEVAADALAIREETGRQRAARIGGQGGARAVPRLPDQRERDEAGLRVLDEQQNRLAEQARARREGRVVPFRFIEEIRTNLERDIASILRGDRSARSATEVFNRYQEALATSMEAQAGSSARLAATGAELERAKDSGDPERIKRAQAAFDLASRASQEVARAQAALNLRIAAVLNPQQASEVFRSQRLAELSTSLGQQAGLIEQFGATRRRLGTAAVAYVAAVERFRAADDPGSFIQDIEAAESAFFAGIQSSTERFTRRIQGASSPSQRRQILGQGLGDLESIRDGLRQQDALRRREEAEARQAVQQARARRDAAARRAGPFGTRLGRAGAGAATQAILGDSVTFGNQATLDLRDAETKLKEARRNYSNARQSVRSSGAALRRGLRELRDARQQMIDAFLADSELADARLRLSNAQTTSPLTQAQNNLERARTNEGAIRAAIRQGLIRGRQKLVALINAQADTAEALQSVQEARDQEVNEALAKMERRSQLRVLRLPDAQRGGATLGDLRNRLAFAQEHGANQETIDNLNIQILEQQQQNAEDAKQRAEDERQRQRETIESLFNLRRSRTDDPQRQARLDVREVDRLLAIPGLSRNERRDLRADRNNKVREREQARVDEKLRKLDLEHDIEKTSDTAYLQGLRALERTLRRGTQARREIHEKILRFKHDMNDNFSDLELNVGDLRLPTVFDVRRLAGQGTNTAIQQVNHYTLSVRNDKDADAIGGELRNLHGANMAALRNAGVT